MSRPPSECSGFTLLEMIVVVVVIAALAGLLVANIGHIERGQGESIVAAELATIRKAALRFQADMGQPPQYIAELLQSPDPGDAMGGWWWRDAADQPEERLRAYDPATQRGWNGPYLHPEYQSTSGSDDFEEARESRVNAAGMIESVDSDASATPKKRLSILRSDTSSFPQTIVSGRLVSHYQLVFNDPSGEILVRFVEDPADATPRVVAELRLGLTP